MKIEKLEKQKLSLVELENIIAVMDYEPTFHHQARSTSFSDRWNMFCAGALYNDFKGVVGYFFNGLYTADVIKTPETRNTLILGTKVIGFVAVAAATTAVLCVKRIPQKLWRKFSNWLDK